MRPRYTFQFPDHNRYDFANPAQVDEYFTERNRQFTLLLKELNDTVNNAQFITVEGKTLQQSVKESKPWSGIMWFYDGSLGEAYRECAKRGWTVQDGQNGSNDLRTKFIRGATGRAGAGGLGGAASGSCTCSFSIAAKIANHVNHDHTGTTDASPQSTIGDAYHEGCSFYWSDYDHVHCFTTDPGADVSGGGTNFLTHSNIGGNQDVTVSVDTVPPYYEAIIVRKD